MGGRGSSNSMTNGGSGGRLVFNFTSETLIPSAQNIYFGGGMPPGTIPQSKGKNKVGFKTVECLIGGSGTFYIVNKNHLIV